MAATGTLASDASETNSGKMPSFTEEAFFAPPLFFLAAFFGMEAAKVGGVPLVARRSETNGFEQGPARETS